MSFQLRQIAKTCNLECLVNLIAVAEMLYKFTGLSNLQNNNSIVAPWRKLLAARLPPVESGVPISVTPRGFPAVRNMCGSPGDVSEEPVT